jgi:hypothetical protein
MSAMSPTDPGRRRLLIFVVLVSLLSSSTFLYVKTTQAHPPHWIDLLIPLMTSMIALMCWLYPQISYLSDVWRRRVAIFFFALSAFELALFFI